MKVQTASGAIDLRDLQGPTELTTASGAIHLTNIRGGLRAASASGDISGTGVARVDEVRSLSGSINLAGDFADDAQILSVSGDVTLRFTPAASVRIDAASLSGDVDADGLPLNTRQSGRTACQGPWGR